MKKTICFLILVLAFTFPGKFLFGQEIINQSLTKLRENTGGFYTANNVYEDSTKIVSVEFNLPQKTFVQIYVKNISTSEIFKTIHEDYLNSGYFLIKFALDSFPKFKNEDIVVIHIDCFSKNSKEKTETVFESYISIPNSK